ncbi:MAG: Dabb family protein [Lentisphaeraceae bacterium]|nr:Dabb family protein [Lentisphaeraceae bacterium]
MIRHTVSFKLKHDSGSSGEQEFIQEAYKLADIPKVNKYEVLREVSPKNNFDFGLSMEFDSQEDYQFYCDHEVHVNFVENVWKPNVVDFLEVDYTAL